jgi:Na+/proline symporter/nitrogen-specific signal transduction histidine kinase
MSPVAGAGALSPVVVAATAFAYLLLLFAIAHWGDRRATEGRSVIDNAWVYALSMAVYCTAWTYFGSVGRAADSGVWFLPIYLGPMLAMLLAWMVVRKMIRIARKHRITSIADFVASRYGKSPVLAGLVTLITVVGIVPYIALQLKAISSGYAVLTGVHASSTGAWWQDSTLYIAMVLAGFTIVFGTRHLDSTERHEGMVAAIAFESLVKLVAFLAVGWFVAYGLFDGLADLFQRADADEQLRALLRFDQRQPFAYTQWLGMTLLAMLSVLFLPRQFQVMVVENVREAHLRRAVWVFPAYMLLINLFVLPIAVGGRLYFGADAVNPETYILSLPLAQGQTLLTLVAFIGGLSAATGMVIVEAIAVSTMICNDLVMPWLLRHRRFGPHGGDLTGWLLGIRRVAILAILLLGYLYFHLAGEAYALVSIGLISFAAVAQFAPAVLGGMYWKGGTREGALAGLVLGFAFWIYTLMLPSLAKSGWLAAGFLTDGPWGLAWLRPEAFLGMQGLDNLTHALFWSLLANIGAYVGVSLWRTPSAAETSQALLFVDVFHRDGQASPVFWQGRARLPELRALAARFLGAERTRRLLLRHAIARGLQDPDALPADAHLVHLIETQLAGAIGSASARVMVASVVEEEALDLQDVMRILDEASQLRAYSQALEEKSRSLERATEELRLANRQLQSLDRMREDFMSSVTHELRTPLTSIRALSELMRDDQHMGTAQRQQFLNIIVVETERLTRLVNQVLDMAKIEAGHADWHPSDVDLRALLVQAAEAMGENCRERGVSLVQVFAEGLPTVRADADRITQVALNLLSNALKYAPPGGGRITMRLFRQEDALVVEVEDNGPGIAPEHQAMVFDKFRQIEGDTHYRPGGTGLGLPISRQIIEHFGGSMWLRSQKGQGACFGFSLPLKPGARVHKETTHESENPDRR